MDTKKGNLVVEIIGSILFCFALTINYFLTGFFSNWISIVIYVGLSILFLLIVIGAVFKKDKLPKFALVGYSIAIVFMLIVGAIYWSGLYLKFYDENGEIKAETIARVIGEADGSNWIFIALAFLQVTFVPISSSIVTMAGVILFGPGFGFLYSLIGQLLGSMVAFYLGRFLGEKFVIWIFGEKSFNKYRDIVKGRDKIMLFFMFLFPFFPDDLLCMFAGLTTFTGPTFLLMVTVTRSLAIGVATLGVELIGVIMGLGAWAYVIFALIFLFVLTLFIVVWKKGDKLEYKMLNFFNRIIPNKLRKFVISDEALDVFKNADDDKKEEINVNSKE